ncbi:unnamed protein product, partial [Lymnaea stagnalis]
MAGNMFAGKHGVNPRRHSADSGDAREGVLELANLMTNPVVHPRDLPIISRGKPKDSIGALNISLHQCARDGDESNMWILLKSLGANVRKKINQYDEDSLTPLHYAARYNHLSVVKLLVEAGADVHAAGEDKITPLHHAARYRRERITRRKPGLSIQTGSHVGLNGGPSSEQLDRDPDGSIVSYLVNKGANINATDIYGQTPLHFAAMRGNEVACSNLLFFKNKIKIEANDNQGYTPLHTAAIHNHVEIARMLIEAGASLMCRDKELCTPLHHAASEGNLALVQLLLDAGANSQEGWITLTEMISATEIEMSSPLHVAVDNGHYEVVKLLLEKCADVNKPRKHFMYPLHLAAQSGDVRIATLLVENHARIDALNDDQATALHRAAALNHVQVVEFLVERY